MKEEKKLLIGFGLFFVLIFSIGILGISRIQDSTTVIKKLGERNLSIEQLILDMKMSNALYAQGIRNYVFSKSPQFSNTSNILFISDKNLLSASLEDFSHYLSLYLTYAVSIEQKKWSEKLKVFVVELDGLGSKILSLAEEAPQGKNKDLEQMMAEFENKSSAIDDFLSSVLSEDNLKEINTQIRIAEQQNKASVLFLILSLILSTCLGGGIVCFVYSGFQNERHKREKLVQRLITVEEEEREDLSRQIHDQLSQDLSALKIYLGLIDTDTPDHLIEQKEKIAKSKAVLRGLIERSHNISELLRPMELDEVGLVETIEALVRKHSELTGYKYSFDKPQEELKFNAQQSLTLYRITQEALTNIAKYSQAKNVAVKLMRQGNQIVLNIIDDGVGFDYELFLRQRRRLSDRRLGLLGLKERVELMGGQMRLDAARGKGTAIMVVLAHRQ